ncbi:5629_t:CDS:2, partial [Racocetra fulgida]
FPTDITEDGYDKFKKKVNKIFKDSHWDTDIALINLEKTGSYSIAIPFGQQIAKNQVIINLKSDLKANNDNFYWNIWQGLIEYARKLDIYDEQLGRRLAIKLILYESPISTMGFDETNQNHIGELDIKVESESNDLTQVNKVHGSGSSLIHINNFKSPQDSNTQDVEMTIVEEETVDYHNIHGYSNPNEINVETAYQDIIVSEDMKTLIELKDTWAKNNHEKF